LRVPLLTYRTNGHTCISSLAKPAPAVRKYFSTGTQSGFFLLFLLNSIAWGALFRPVGFLLEARAARMSSVEESRKRSLHAEMKAQYRKRDKEKSRISH
jgi:hypothetical protein